MYRTRFTERSSVRTKMMFAGAGAPAVPLPPASDEPALPAVGLPPPAPPAGASTDDPLPAEPAAASVRPGVIAAGEPPPHDVELPPTIKRRGSASADRRGDRGERDGVDVMRTISC